MKNKSLLFATLLILTLTFTQLPAALAGSSVPDPLSTDESGSGSTFSLKVGQELDITLFESLTGSSLADQGLADEATALGNTTPWTYTSTTAADLTAGHVTRIVSNIYDETVDTNTITLGMTQRGFSFTGATAGLTVLIFTKLNSDGTNYETLTYVVNVSQ